MTTRPHDALFKAVFGVPAYAAELCRAVLPRDVVDLLDLATLEVEPSSFVDRDLADTHGDLLLGVALLASAGRGSAAHALVYVLVEHQSRASGDMPIRLLGYLGAIWRRELRAAPDGPLPLIIPVVVSHAPGGWTAPRSLRDMFGPDASTGPLADFRPWFRIIVEDLSTLSNDDLVARVPALVPRLTWWMLRDARDPPRLLANVATWAADLEAATRRDPATLDQLLRYLTIITDRFSLEQVHAKLTQHSPRTAEAAMTAGEELIQQGLQQGLRQGLQQGLAGTLHKLLVQRFGPLTPAQSARLAAASPAQLDRALDRILLAPTADGVFED